jgi:hypothetical protein
MDFEEMEQRLPSLFKLSRQEKGVLPPDLVVKAMEEFLTEITRLDLVVREAIDFAAACVETGSGYMSEAEKWEWVARSYEQFCSSHSWMPTISYLLEQYAAKERYENEISEKAETVEDFHKPAAPKFEE